MNWHQIKENERKKKWWFVSFHLSHVYIFVWFFFLLILLALLCESASSKLVLVPVDLITLVVTRTRNNIVSPRYISNIHLSDIYLVILALFNLICIIIYVQFLFFIFCIQPTPNSILLGYFCWILCYLKVPLRKIIDAHLYLRINKRRRVHAVFSKGCDCLF